MDNEEEKQTTTPEKAVDDQPTTEEGENQTETVDDEPIDGDKLVEKLKHRLGKEQSDKNSALDQVDELTKKLAAYESGEVSVKKLSDEDKKQQAEKQKDDELTKLRNKVKIMESTQQADDVLKEAGLNVGPDVLKMVVSTDDDTTYQNAKTLATFVNEIRESTRQEFLKGRTPKATGRVTKGTVTPDEFDAMTLSEKLNLQVEDPEQYNKLIGGI